MHYSDNNMAKDTTLIFSRSDSSSASFLPRRIVNGYESNSRFFERFRIRALAEKRENMQKKAFEKWVNSHLSTVTSKIFDLYVDLRDGKMLLKLLEVLSRERLPRPTMGKLRIHCMENVDKALQFLREQRVHLENIGPGDIVDGNPYLTLGLVWSIMLRFHFQNVTEEDAYNHETMSAKSSLLLWCQTKTAGYRNVNVVNFTTSWRDGLAFNAIIHKHRPDLVEFDKLSKRNAMYNLNHAFNVVEDKLGLRNLLEAKNVVKCPDEKSIVTYIMTLYNYFSNKNQKAVQRKRICKVIGVAMENDKDIRQYESWTSNLLQWIDTTIFSLNDHHFPNSLKGVQNQITQFNHYRYVTKPSKLVEKGTLDVTLFNLQTKMRANNESSYTPKNGKLISDIDKAWKRLEEVEHKREFALREELIRQERLQQLASRFNRKANMFEEWLSENLQFVSQINFFFDLEAVVAAIKKDEAIELDILAYDKVVQVVVSLSQKLEIENYHDVDRIRARKDNILELWNYLLVHFRIRSIELEMYLQNLQIFEKMLQLIDSMEGLKMRLLSSEHAKHLMDVEYLLQQHSMIEADVNVLGMKVNDVVNLIQECLNEESGGFHPDHRTLYVVKQRQLVEAYGDLVKLVLEQGFMIYYL